MTGAGNFRAWTTAAVVACGLLLPSAASADEAVVAGPPSLFLTQSVTIDQGEPLTFYNFDVLGHDVTAVENGGDGQPLFNSPIIGVGESAFVEGSQYLSTGSYDFLCSIHQNMQGTLTVTGAGAPVTRPGPGDPPPSDTTRPKVEVAILSAGTARVRRARKLALEVAVDEAATIALRATARARGRVTTLGKGRVDLTGAGKRRQLLKLTRAGRKALAKRARLRVTVTARAKDRAGNVSKAKTSRLLKG